MWKNIAAVFQDRAAEYDAWFDDSLPFHIELQALRELKTGLSAPMLEIGVGPGRFASALGVRFGIDPALAPLRIASGRGIAPCQAVGEHLPVKPGGVCTIFLLFTLCFLENPQQVLGECYRALPAAGHIVLGFINGSSAWGEMLENKKKQGHVFYEHARFYDSDTIFGWLADIGFKTVETRFALVQRPDDLREIEKSEDGLNPEAGFLIAVAEK